MNKKSVLITGSSRGIGRACAKAYAKAGYHVFLNCVHQVERLEELAQEMQLDEEEIREAIRLSANHMEYIEEDTQI